MSRIMRYYLVIWGLGSFALAVAFYFRWSFVEDFWPWSGGGYYGSEGDLTRLSFYFVSSVMAAIALPNVWLGLSGEFAAITGGALNLALAFTGITIYMLQDYSTSADNRLLTSGVVVGAMAVVSVLLAVWSRRFAYKDQRPTPLPVRVAFGFFTIVLIVVGGMLVTKRPDTFPWTLRDEVSVVYGWVFLGAAAYFGYGVLVPKWHNACGQLLGFLAYDVVLILPFLDHFDVARGAQRTSLILYTAVVVSSALLAVYYLFLHPRTRLWRSRPVEALEAT
ncbi:MAG: hypothetical protein Kow00106_06490 [Anaerolineae bacterium]